ncbi:MAG: 2-dehydro-3-deoxyphosphogluconate aldolase [Microbacterium sp. SCN 70-200]|uniref:bifunctional 4-hydroxy-2-oxoglutarate aldolase/2-dehydro-3-deoxy-phosphogluconate aldolase n=1 Tax=unclassified Microbacterium TaxID=2609290 RepID=UPI0008683EE7|nr:MULTISPECIES: bifunctional 4-hydroxy-2-oxoglutarate aldolase/2-dehydro-3-deoxy-phosphogluconate aldolase [unclassified Microbacterium]MBN9215394.1 bifunctional 4-hydroxy-2-oxoglutarate aldolase/2-dehydro-3-deoxy-phosphogluconate aldolase [Microbacterium sp.]ODT41162.1 MAG: 2-dehydro-3-deoxyphosphogluconate aldolase [Microbacterium sp. SCN 70-200]OJV79442.1 MAG: 2-dehydro-3-deoxyphosphogluconate aldolase [Microbacterium sp. 70-16]
MTLDTAPFFEQTFAGAPLMAILRSAGVERAVRVARTAWELGLDSVEVTIQSDADVDALREVARLGRERGAVVGAGTIVSPDQVQVAIDAGAGYLVSPGLDADVVRAAQAAGIPILAGVATPSEVQRAVALGLTWLKAFPAQWLGTDWFRHIRGPFPQVQFIATGGMDASNAADFLAAGVRVVAVGSALEDETQLEKLAALLRTPR